MYVTGTMSLLEGLGWFDAYMFLTAVVTKYHKLGGFKEQKFILSQLCRLEVQDQGVTRAMLSLKALEENLFHVFLLTSDVASILDL